MTRYDCRRCKWVPDPDAESSRGQLLGHARETGHPLCILCSAPLPWDRPMTCLPCLADVRRALAELVQLYALLPAAMLGGAYGEPAKPRSDGSGESGFPGGDHLVMLAGGSRAGEQVWNDEAERVEDPQSVAFELSRWEDDWRLTRREPAATGAATVSGAADYLGSRLGWAADHHEAFDEFGADVRRLLSRLRTATATDDRPETGAPCFDCGATLERVRKPAKSCRHERPSQSLLDVPLPAGVFGPLRLESTEDRDERLAAWVESHARCELGGLEDVWRCPRCRRQYSDPEYWLAVRAEMETRRSLQDWVPLQEAVDASRRPHKTLRTWMRRGQVLAACRISDRQLVVWWPNVYERVFSTERRASRRRSA